jgi:hypothetical protein
MQYQGEQYEISQSTTPLVVDVEQFGIRFAKLRQGCYPAITPISSRYLQAHPFEAPILPQAQTQIQYSINNACFVVSRIQLSGAVDFAPRIDGVLPLCDEAGRLVYADICCPVDYTGKLLIVRDAYRDNYIGLHNPYPFRMTEAYDYIYELVLENGRLLATYDHSSSMTQLRKTVLDWYREHEKVLHRMRIAMFNEQIPTWLQDNYTHDYDPWWLPEY